MKYRVLLLVLLLVYQVGAQICQDPESDTFYVVEAEDALRRRLNDYHTEQTWSDTTLRSFLYQSAWSLRPQKRDTIVTTTASSYTLNSDFSDIRGVMVKNDGRWSSLLKPDSSGTGSIVKFDTIVVSTAKLISLNNGFQQCLGLYAKTDGRWSELIKPDSAGVGKLIKQDTIITTSLDIMYQLNADFINVVGVIIKRPDRDRWVSLKPRPVISSPGDTLYGLGTDNKIVDTYSIIGRQLLIDAPPIDGGDTIIVFYSAFEYMIYGKRLVVSNPVKGDSLLMIYRGFEYFVSDKRLYIPAPNSSDSLIVFYYAYPNNFTGDSVIVNIPFADREALIERAFFLATRADNN